MKIIVGLGNPGKKYEKTRHNLGFMAIDKLSDELNISINKEKFQGIIGTGEYKKEKIILVKPTTYMNLSGDCVQEVLNFYKATPSDLVVIYDDFDIDVGKIRIREKGSAGTHNGMRDITAKINSKDFIRIRIGSGKPSEDIDLADYVLSKVSKDEVKIIDQATTNAKDAVVEFLNNGIHSAMNKFN